VTVHDPHTLSIKVCIALHALARLDDRLIDALPEVVRLAHPLCPRQEQLAVVASSLERTKRRVTELWLELLMDTPHNDGVRRGGPDAVPDLAVVQNDHERRPPLAEDRVKSIECGIDVSTEQSVADGVVPPWSLPR
jgi:hypothetical protein